MEDYEINLLELIKYILKKWKTVLLCAIALCAIMVGYSYCKTYTIYRSQSELLVESEDINTQVNKMGIYNRSDLVQQALSAIGSSSDVASVSKNISVSRLNFSNYVTINYKTRNEKENVNLLSVLTHHIADTINSIPGYKVSVSTPAHTVASTQNGPSKSKYAIFGAAGGAGLAALFFVIKYIADGKLRDTRYLEKNLKYRILDERSAGADYYELRTNLIYGFKGRKIIAVNNLNSGEDIAKGLAEAMAEINKKVLLIDGGEENKLFMLLKSKKKASTFIKHEKDYDIISYQDLSEDVNALMTDEFDQLIKEFAEEYDYVIINTSGSNTNVLKLMDARSDGVVLAVKKDVTSVKDLQKAHEALNMINADVIGTVYVR